MNGPPAGLCQDCLHSRQVTSARGSVFHLCVLHEQDALFPKYPRLPVIACQGYRPRGQPSTR